jgi:cobalamin biosynthesis protein CobT
MGNMYGQTIEDFHIGDASPSFVSNMRRMLQARSVRHYTMGHKAGKLARSRLYRVGLPPIDSGDWNSKVFKKRTQETDLLDTCASIVCDWSGSMGGSKAEHAAKGASLINAAFSQVLHIPVEILAFSSHGSRPSIAVIKSFDKKASSDQIAERFYKFLAYMAGNNDADSLLYAYSRILPRKEKRKLMIVMSDGAPADGIGDPSYALKQVTQRITQEKRVELYGLGMMDRNVERFYPRWKVVDNGGSIEQALVEVLGEMLK